MKQTKTDAQKQIEKAKRDSLRAEFLTQWRRLGGPELVEEFKFHLVRDWAFDFAHEASRVCIDLQGGNWVNGAHVRPAQYSRDCKKHNTAILMGFRVFWFTTDMIANDPAGHLEPVIELIKESP